MLLLGVLVALGAIGVPVTEPTGVTVDAGPIRGAPRGLVRDVGIMGAAGTGCAGIRGGTFAMGATEAMGWTLIMPMLCIGGTTPVGMVAGWPIREVDTGTG